MMKRESISALTATAGLLSAGTIAVGALASSVPIMSIGAATGLLAAATNVGQAARGVVESVRAEPAAGRSEH